VYNRLYGILPFNKGEDMKKKIIALTVLVVLVLSLALTGCTFIKVNNERKANEIMATVSIDNDGNTLSLDITRNELLSYVNYIINLYSQYGMSYDAAKLIDQGLDSLINQKYLVLQGMVYLSKIDARKEVMYANTDEYKAVYGDKLTPEGVLTISERYASVASTNESFKTSIETYVTDYNNEKRELALASAKEELTAYYQNGYTVKKDGVTIAHEQSDAENGYADGLYQKSFVISATASSSDSEEKKAETDYTKIILKIVLVKDGESDKVVYMPVSSGAVTTEVKEDAEFISNYVTTKICKVTYEEPVTDEDGETTYTSHVAEEEFTLVTPRTAYKGTEEEEETDLINGDVPHRYVSYAEFVAAASSADDSKLKEIYNDGQIFVHTKKSYENEAEKDAYRQFRENKKSMNINFEATIDDSYNGLGYYYLSSFESAVLSAVQHELKKAELTANPVSSEKIAEQYKVMVEKQKEEYSVLTPAEQVKKFAETVKTDLTKAYYVPVDALKNETFEYKGKEYHYADVNEDGTITINMFYIGHILFKWDEEVKEEMDRYLIDRGEEETKEIKKQFIEILETNKSKLDFATAEKQGETLSDAFEVNEDGTIKKYSVTAVIAELAEKLATAENGLDVFKEYMTYFNDDSGSMSSKLGYFIPMGDIDHGYDGDDFPNMAIDLYLDCLEKGINPADAKKMTEYAFTSYGLHMEYISFAPFYHITLDANGGLGVDKALDLDGSKFSDTIKENLESQVSTNVYNNWTKQYGSEQAMENAVKNSKKVKSLLKDLGLD